ncbi:MAG: copper oxidase, partial [Pseudomonas mandelii]
MDRNARPPCKWFGLLTPLSVLLTMTLGTTTLQASPIVDERQPEPSDPSAYYDEPADEAAALNAILTLPEANADSFDLPDGVKGSRDTTRTENILPPAMQTSFNYPTNGKPSPLFGAQPFTQQMVLFEAFGPD